MTFDHSKYYFDQAAVEKVVKFITQYCSHVKGDKAGELLVLDKWQIEDIIKPIFGIKRKDNGKRRYKTVYIEIGKGNAKSTLSAAFALYFLGADGQKGSEVYSAAGDRFQARIIFDTARNMVKQSAILSEHFEVYQHSIVKKNSANSYQVLSADAGTKHGLIPSAIIFDEVHVQPNRDLWDTLTAGQMKRDDSICIALTTAGQNKESICYELHEKTRKLNEGIIQDDSFYGLIYAAKESDDIGNPKTWKKANPGLGTIITYDNLKIEYQKVVSSPTYENTFRRLHLNQWVDAYESWISDLEWSKCNIGRNESELLNTECYGGLDLAATRDFNSLVLIFPNGENDIDIKCWFWLPKDMLDNRIERQNINFTQWVKDGYIRLVAGNSVDHNLMLSDIIEISKQYNIKSVAYDRKFAAPIVTGLEAEDINVTAFDQSIMNISFPTKQLDIMVAKRQINHFNNPVLRWMMSNVSIYRDPNDNIKVHKAKSTDKVDGVVALIMAIGEWISFKMNGNQQSVYETRGVVTLDEIK